MIKYKAGYEYQLVKTYSITTNVLPPVPIRTKFISLSVKGRLTLKHGYAWDGPTKAVHTKNFIRASLLHDGLYQLMREGYLASEYRKEADDLMRQVCLEDGMSAIRAWWVYETVRAVGWYAIQPDGNPVLTAP